jgi:AcrR family transcriptional regulator
MLVKKGQSDGTLTSEKPPKTRQRSRDKTKDELQLAMLRVRNNGKKLTISAVASEAGVSPGLIHNTYPDIAEAIRAEVGKGTRQQRDEKIAELSKIRERIKELRGELDVALSDIQRLASANETLRQEVAKLQSTASRKVVIFPTRDSGQI